MRIARESVVLLGVSLFAAGLLAEEGMWMPQQIPELAAKLRALGFKGDPKAFADLGGQPMGAIVSLGGCTASFVSPDGLIVEFTVDPPGVEQVEAIRRADAHSELARWMAGDHRTNNDLRPR